MSGIAQPITRKNYDATYHPPDSLVTEAVEQVVDRAIKEAAATDFVVGQRQTRLSCHLRRGLSRTPKAGSALADKIFKGIEPSELPTELPYKLNLVLNPKTAKAIDLKIAKEILLRAAQVFE